MARQATGSVLRQMHTLFNVGTCAGLSDGQLLERFLGRTDEAAELAFAVLLERHGPLVLRVCQRVLADPHDVDDAFQATFLVLVRRAHAIRERESVASWLYGVAFRVAACARAAAARRRRLEREGATMKAQAHPAAAPEFDLRPVLDEEIRRLPERFRAPIVLVDLEGLALERAANQLGCPLGTLKSRLARGREKLRGRLLRRGLGPALGALGALLTSESARAATVPRVLLEQTAKAAVNYAAGSYTAAGAISAAAASLTEGVLKSMFFAKLKPALLALGLLATSAGVWAASGDDSTPGKEGNEGAPANAQDKRLGDLESKVDSLLKLLSDMRKDSGPQGERLTTPRLDFVAPNYDLAPLQATRQPNAANAANLYRSALPANTLGNNNAQGQQGQQAQQGQPQGQQGQQAQQGQPQTQQGQQAQAQPGQQQGATFFTPRPALAWYFDLPADADPTKPGSSGTPRFTGPPLGPGANADVERATKKFEEWVSRFEKLSPDERSEHFFRALAEIAKFGPVRVSCTGDVEASVRLPKPSSLERAKPILKQMLTQGPLHVNIEGMSDARYYTPANNPFGYPLKPSQGWQTPNEAFNQYFNKYSQADQAAGNKPSEKNQWQSNRMQNAQNQPNSQNQKQGGQKPNPQQNSDPALVDRVTKIEQQLDQILKVLSDRKPNEEARP